MSPVRSLDPRTRARTLAELRQLAARLAAEFPTEAVYAFGSFARGEEHEGSDIDLLIVGDIPGRMPERIGEVLRRTDLPVEPIVVSRASLQRYLAEEHPFYTLAVKEGLRIW